MFEREDLPRHIQNRLRDDAPAVDVELFPPGFFAQPPREAAVLIPLLKQADGWHLVFIRRACNVNDRHSGEVAFPGGRVDAIDSNHEAAALREAAEEIGLAPENVTVLGRFGAYRTASNYRVTPVVGQVRRAFAPVPDPTEVERVFSIPLVWLADPGNLEQRSRRLPECDTEIPVLFFRPYQGEQVWGVTARLVQGFVARVIGRADR
ncbi:MAG: NUDIX hydrolase [Thiotrichales bacterium]